MNVAPFLLAVLNLAILPLSRAADWEPVLTDLLQSEKTGYGGL